MRIKEGASLRGLRPEMAVALLVVAEVWRELGARPPVLTSATDGRHMRGSLHYVGAAVDIRLPEGVDATRVRVALETALGGPDRDFDVVLEKTHIHVELQPKGALNA